MSHVLQPSTVVEIEGTGLVGNAFFSELSYIRHLSRDAAQKYITSRYGRMSAAVQNDLLELAIAEPDVPLVKGKLYAVVWLCDASWGQIAAIFGVNQSSVSRLASRYVSPEVRAELMRGRHKYRPMLTPTKVSAIIELYNRLSSSDKALIRDGTVQQIAKRIRLELAGGKYEETEADSPYDAIFTPSVVMVDQVPPDEPKPPADEPEPIEHIVTKASDMTAFDQMFGKK